MRRIFGRALGLGLWAAVPAAASAASAAAPAQTLGGLRLEVSKEGPFQGLIDTSPLARSEVALRADPRTRAVVIGRRGWTLTVGPEAVKAAYLADACAILTAHGIPPSVIVEVRGSDRSAPALKRVCAGVGTP